MPDYELVGLYHTHAIGLPNAPPLPEHGIHARPFGPWEIPMATYELAVEFADANPQIEWREDLFGMTKRISGTNRLSELKAHLEGNRRYRYTLDPATR